MTKPRKKWRAFFSNAVSSWVVGREESPYWLCEGCSKSAAQRIARALNASERPAPSAETSEKEGER